MQFHILFTMKIILRHLLYGTYFTTLILRQILLQHAPAIFLQNGTNITKCISFFITECGKLLLQNARVLLQNATVITKWNDFITKCNSYLFDSSKQMKINWEILLENKSKTEGQLKLLLHRTLPDNSSEIYETLSLLG